MPTMAMTDGIGRVKPNDAFSASAQTIFEKTCGEQNNPDHDGPHNERRAVPDWVPCAVPRKVRSLPRLGM